MRGLKRRRISPPAISPSASAVRISPHGGRAAEVLVRDRRPEHALDSELDRVDEPELEHDHPQPRPRAELAPAVTQLGEEVRRLHA